MKIGMLIDIVYVLSRLSQFDHFLCLTWKRKVVFLSSPYWRSSPSGTVTHESDRFPYEPVFLIFSGRCVQHGQQSCSGFLYVIFNLTECSCPTIDLFHNGGRLLYSLICMIISLSDLLWKYEFSQCILYLLTRPERLIIIHTKKYIIGLNCERGLIHATI